MIEKYYELTCDGCHVGHAIMADNKRQAKNTWRNTDGGIARPGDEIFCDKDCLKHYEEEIKEVI